MRRFILILAAAVNLTVIDQFVKKCTLGYFKLGESKAVIDGFFSITHVQNRGCAWGMFQGHVWPLAVFAVFALALVMWKRKTFFTQDKFGVACEILLYAGLLGNLIDRVFRGAVVDMFDFHWSWYSFPVFNVADIYITMAAFLLVGSALFSKEPEK